MVAGESRQSPVQKSCSPGTQSRVSRRCALRAASARVQNLAGAGLWEHQKKKPRRCASGGLVALCRRRCELPFTLRPAPSRALWAQRFSFRSYYATIPILMQVGDRTIGIADRTNGNGNAKSAFEQRPHHFHPFRGGGGVGIRPDVGGELDRYRRAADDDLDSVRAAYSAPSRGPCSCNATVY